jgi:putative glutathione S-transferase
VINYWSIKRSDPTGIIPKGTPVNYAQSHDRGRLAA